MPITETLFLCTKCEEYGIVVRVSDDGELSILCTSSECSRHLDYIAIAPEDAPAFAEHLRGLISK